MRNARLLRQRGEPHKMGTIERYSRISPADFVDRFALHGRPVIVTDLVKSWKSTRRWTDDYLTAKLGGRQFFVSESETGNFGIFSSRMRDNDRFTRLSFGEIVSLMSRSGAVPNGGRPVYYLQQKIIDETFPELVEDVEYPDFLDRSAIRDVNLWLSQRGSNIPLHYDTYDNLLAQIRGSKRLRLFDPAQTIFLYPGRDGAPFASRLDLDDIDHETFPLATRASMYADIRLEEGEILYLPAFWWHHVVTETAVSLSLNYWYHFVCGAKRDPYVNVRDLLAICGHYVDQLPDAQRKLAVRDGARLFQGRSSESWLED